MLVIEPLKIRSSETGDVSKIGSVVSVMGRLATVAENRNVNVSNIIDANENTASAQIIVSHFTKRDYHLPFPVDAEIMDNPLIEFIKKARSTNKKIL